MIFIVLFQILWMVFLWLVFTSRLSSQTTWLKVKPYCKSFSQACSEDVFKFFQSQTCDYYRLTSDLMDVFSMAGVHQQAEQPNYLAESQTLL